MWNHRIGRERGELRPWRHFSPQTIKLPCRASCHTPPPRTQHQRVYWIQAPVINKFSIFCPSGASPTSKRKRMVWCGISVCLSLLLYKAARLSAPRHRRGAAAQIWFHDFHLSTWQVGAVVHVFCRFRLHAPGVELITPNAIRYENLCAKDPSFLGFCAEQREKKKYQKCYICGFLLQWTFGKVKYTESKNYRFPTKTRSSHIRFHPKHFFWLTKQN